MNKRTKKLATGAVLIAAAIIGLVLVVQQNTPSSQQALIPEDKITHGHGLAVDVQDPNKLYIATHHGLLVLLNEKELYRVGKSRDDYMGFSAHPTNPQIFFSSGHPSTGGNVGFQKSEDGGFTWKRLSSGVGGPVDFHAMAMSPANPDLIYGWYKGSIQRSTDGGRNWQVVNSSILAVSLTAHPTDENIVYAATPRGLLVSTNQGADWTSLSKDLDGSQTAAVAINPQNPQHLLTSTSRLGLGKSTDGGATWEKIPAAIDGEILFLAFSTQNPSTVYALTHTNAVYKSTDSGETWNKIR